MSADVQDWPAFHTPHNVRREHVPAALDYKPILDRPRPPHPVLNQLMDDALRTILLVSDGGVTSFTKDRISGSKPGTIAPTSALAQTIDDLGTRYMACRTHRKRLAVIKEAQATADRLRYSPKSYIAARGSAEWREMIANDPRPQRVVTADYRCSSKTITAARKEFGKS